MKNALAVILLIALGITPPLRLHVVANSDSPVDQMTKLAVRDAILEQMQMLGEADSRDQAIALVVDNGSKLQSAAEQVLAAQDADYGATLRLGRFSFPKKTYGDMVYPAGSYDALQVVLGDGEGLNWWCVMYPPLCLGKTSPPKKVVFRSAILDALRRKS